MSAVKMVMAPRDIVAEYWHRPWAEVVAAAERGDDGLCVRSPRFTPARVVAPLRSQYKDDADGNAQYEKDAEAFALEANQAFLREGDMRSTIGKTLLFQQNW